MIGKADVLVGVTLFFGGAMIFGRCWWYLIFRLERHDRRGGCALLLTRPKRYVPPLLVLPPHPQIEIIWIIITITSTIIAITTIIIIITITTVTLLTTIFKMTTINRYTIHCTVLPHPQVEIIPLPGKHHQRHNLLLHHHHHHHHPQR